MTANNKQIGGDHYKKLKIQVWDFVLANKLNFIQGLAIRYIVREKDNKLQDLEKAKHCIEKLIEEELKKDGMSNESIKFYQSEIGESVIKFKDNLPKDIKIDITMVVGNVEYSSRMRKFIETGRKEERITDSEYPEDRERFL